MSTQDDQDTRDNEEIAFSRSGLPSPHGKLEDPMKTHVDYDTGLAFRKLCREAMPDGDVAKVLRDFIFLKVHGKRYTDIVHDAGKSMADSFFGTGPNEDQSGGAA
jgi:hypothetical protein